MKDICILVPRGETNLSSIVGSWKILCRANELWTLRSGESRFRILLVGEEKESQFHGDLFSVRPQMTPEACQSPYLIVVPSLNHHYDSAVELNNQLICWIRDQYHSGSRIASICTGAFLLAAAGILDNRSCSTHWSAATELKNRFPDIRIEADRCITDENGIYTNGGAFSFLNLILYLTEKLFDREIALQCAKIFQIDPDRTSQSPFIIFSGQKNHKDEVVSQAQAYIEANTGEKIAVNVLSNRFNLSRRNFDRRFLKATGNSPLEYAQRVKMEVVKKGLESTNKQINELMYDVGYSDTKAFREIFRKYTGLSPLEYRTRFAMKP